MKKFQLGVIGAGDRAVGYLKGIFGKLRDEGTAEVLGVADINPVRAREGQKDLGAKHAFEDYRKLLDLKELDAVFIMTPDFTHAPIVQDAQAAGKHIYCEKPMATTLEACNDIVMAAEKAGVIFFAGHNVRYGNTGRTMHRLIMEGKIGNLRMVWARRFVEGAKYWHRWHRDKTKSGGLLVHKGCHYMDQMNWHSNSRPRYVAAFGGLNVHTPRDNMPKRCSECQEKCPHYMDIGKDRHERYFLNAEKHDGYIRDLCVYAPGATVFDNAVVAIEYANEVRGTYMECHFAPISDMETEVGAVGDEGLLVRSRHSIGSSGAIEKNAVIRFESTKTKTAEIVPIDDIKPAGDEATVRAFIDCLNRGEQPESSYEDGWDSAVLGIAAQTAAAERKTVEILPESRQIRII